MRGLGLRTPHLIEKVLVLSLCVLAAAQTSRAVDNAPELVEVFWQGRGGLQVPGVTGVIVLDESICRAEVSTDHIQFFGLKRGETVALVWVREQRIGIRVRVVERPVVPIAPRLSKSALESLGQGVVGSSTQVAIAPNGEKTLFLLHHFDWQQRIGDSRLSIRGQAQDSTVPGMPLFNANSASIAYESPRTALTLMDFPLEVNGGMKAKVSPYSTYNAYMIRGADVRLKRGSNVFELFGGATIPPYFLSFDGARDVAGINFIREHRSGLSLYTTTGWVSAPFTLSDAGTTRKTSLFQTAGLAWKPTDRWAIQGTVGGSTRGGMAQGTVSYTGVQVTAFLTGTTSSPTFPLNQLQLFFGGGSSVTAGTNVQMNSRVAASVYFQHSETRPTAFFPTQGAANYFNPNLTISLSRRQALTLNYTLSRYESSLIPASRNQTGRIDVALSSQLGRQVSNTAQVIHGALSDPLGMNSQGEFTFRDSLSFPIRVGYINFNVEHSRQDPSLVRRLNEQINLLPLSLQQLFQLDPVVFTQSLELPSDIRVLLENLRPTNTMASVSGQFRIGRKFTVSPNAGYIRNAPGLNRGTSSHLLGYSLSYQAAPGLQFTSSLANVLLFDFQGAGLQRTTVVTVGLNKTFTGGLPSPLPFRQQKGIIRGRVFRDLNVDGRFNGGESGLAGVRVQLDTGQLAVTDAEGRFEFRRLKPGPYEVRLPLSQFQEPVRMTTSGEASLDLVEERNAEVHFGVVDFARLIGNVFNDYAMDGQRHPDANGLRHVKLILQGNGASRAITTDGGGDFEVCDVVPGNYQLTLDPATLPSNFVGPGGAISVRVAPVTTVVQDIPVRAIRSLSGHVYFRNGATHSVNGSSQSGEASQDLKGLPGVRLAIGDAVATTDDAGAFILRNLPAGQLTLSVVPARALPAGLDAPTGRVKLPQEPIQAENTKIYISNPGLLECLSPRMVPDEQRLQREPVAKNSVDVEPARDGPQQDR
jgi:hypothetical protein